MSTISGPSRSNQRTELYSKVDYIKLLPDEFETPELTDHELVDGPSDVPLASLRSVGAVERYYDDDAEREQYRVTDVAHELVGAVKDGKGFSPCPCGHTGLHNLGDDRFECGFELCDREFAREHVEVSDG